MSRMGTGELDGNSPTRRIRLLQEAPPRARTPEFSLWQMAPKRQISHVKEGGRLKSEEAERSDAPLVTETMGIGNNRGKTRLDPASRHVTGARSREWGRAARSGTSLQAAAGAVRNDGLDCDCPKVFSTQFSMTTVSSRRWVPT